MTGTPARRFLRPALLVAALFGAASAPAQNAVPVSIAASDKPKDAAWVAMPIDEVRQRAHGGDVGAMEELGRRLMSGSGVPRDTSSGAGWFRRAADAGSPTAAFTTGVLYERGLGIERDSIKAVEWYRQAAAGDVPAAKHNLALLLRDGKGAPQDGPKAVELLRAAARQGMTASMYTLGDMYERGGAVLKDPAAALAWFAITHEVELQASNGVDTPLSTNAQARGKSLQLVITGADRERAEKIGEQEYRQLALALSPKPAVRAEPSPPPGPVPAPPAAAAEEPPTVAWPKTAIEQIKVVQQALIDLQRLRGKADGAAGPATRAAIRDFEKSVGLPETAQPSREVYAALIKAGAKPAPAAPSEAWPPDSADQIRAIQRLLGELKLLNAAPTGTVGPLTRRAIRDYQRKAGVKETGEPSEELFESLKAARTKSGG